MTKHKEQQNRKAVQQQQAKPKYTQQEIEEVQSHALELYHADQNHAQELGQALLRVKAVLPHGLFNTWWRNNKLSQARVSYCMRLAQGKVKAAKINLQRK